MVPVPTLLLLLLLLLLFLLVLLLKIWRVVPKFTASSAVTRVNKHSDGHSLLAATSHTPRYTQKQRNEPHVMVDIQGGEQFERSALWNYCDQMRRQWQAEESYRCDRWHYTSSDLSAKRIFQLAAPTEELAECSVGALKKWINWCVLYLLFN